MLANRKILLCVSGGIAVYKAVALVSKLSQAGASVKVIMTQSATNFVQPLTFQVMSRNDVYFDTFDEKDSSVIAHIDLADWADLIVVAPATANVIGKLANGIGDDMVTTTLLAATAPIWVAPAMNVHMYDHPAVKRNIQQLHEDGIRFIEPSEGFLACGYVGKGRLEEPEKITALISDFFARPKILAGKKVVVTAGPTRERIDPVRFLTNFSSGKMGYAMAQAAAEMGAETILISGPVSLPVPSGVRRISVESAEDMLNAVKAEYASADVVIKTAAVADYRPITVEAQKMKKKEGGAAIELERTVDILQTLGQEKSHQLLIGFAAETNDVAHYAKGKLVRKNADYIIANDVSEAQAGFESDTNRVTVYGKDDFEYSFEMMPKDELARRLLQMIVEREALHDR
ncbi:bifunctional phosphopantothenoylcysteine decarboxylase/phosphopantothenate--cysteine ligase CoaBC [Planococcus sp. N028]|uniref:Coenzyme A biosynthesis bifunctional protein CoaBC n=1 Tax=Planococcus shixiaomingii TaxID=3058393 RepID=A0ABT8N0P9_9BACL|nr:MULTISPECIES: bifunctional phosphopantothenoylcysteine decarboxylase/phosphopantothenate--cysteine ligase CoaBC [unclassified Planococcus (in: firmicutes)]MDN7241298.1 bifunctional phosphopantothenoylcysteine decarboxylase/phosphopantothenate--cysteine ligase CoaBC [Planococcus sp. N028]WKA53556.1 bifunctional phosphopantothenoylcysteine decarboxylase/phosphopantothenate--cysteine ligase CoaBC [Planococcus sp. N022]